MINLGENVYLNMSEILYSESKIGPCLIFRILKICVLKKINLFYYLFLNYKRKGF